MSDFNHGSISAVPTTAPTAYAFRINGHVDDDDVEAMAGYMNEAFDRNEGKVDMLIDLSEMTGRDLDAIFDGDVLKAQVRSWSNVGRYIVLGAPVRAAKMIAWMDKIIPVEARAYDAAEADAAWAFLGAVPANGGDTEVGSATRVSSQ